VLREHEIRVKIGSSDETVRVDLPLHSRASGSATNVWVKGLGDDGDVRESYTLPEESYRMAKRAGMDFVTLTDHETIDGSLTLLHHPDFLVGEEVSARFPEDGGYADILLYGLDAGSHVEAQDRRSNIYDLVEYLREARIVHVLAHPMYSVTKPLDKVAVEKRWRRGVKPIIARRGTEHGSGLGRWRWVVERIFSWIDQNRRMSLGTTRGSYVRAGKRW
jgi:predicted metal-dependent phosphoesterase TrpH